jgi:integrase
MIYSKTPINKSSKGSVVIISSHNRLQLRFSYGGKRHYLSIGLPDTPTNRKLAELKASEIEKDIIYERFDPTLKKYKMFDAD